MSVFLSYQQLGFVCLWLHFPVNNFSVMSHLSHKLLLYGDIRQKYVSNQGPLATESRNLTLIHRIYQKLKFEFITDVLQDCVNLNN